MSLTELELNVLLRVEDGVDPWRSAPTAERIGRSDSRCTSQALGRLERKGFVECVDCVYGMTLSGREALTKERGVGGRLWQDGRLYVVVVIAPPTSWGPNRGFRHAVIPGETRSLCGRMVDEWQGDIETADGVPFEAAKVGCRVCILAHTSRTT